MSAKKPPRGAKAYKAAVAQPKLTEFGYKGHILAKDKIKHGAASGHTSPAPASSSASSTSSTTATDADAARFDCPLGCGARVSLGMANVHIDMCLLEMSRRGRAADRGSNKGSNKDSDMDKDADIDTYADTYKGKGKDKDESITSAHIPALASACEPPPQLLSPPLPLPLPLSSPIPLPLSSPLPPSLPLPLSLPRPTALQPPRPFAACARISRPREVPGLLLIHDFLSEEEEAALIASIDGDTDTPWRHSSFNGHCMSKVRYMCWYMCRYVGIYVGICVVICVMYVGIYVRIYVGMCYVCRYICMYVCRYMCWYVLCM
jgi:hypothetical protein